MRDGNYIAATVKRSLLDTVNDLQTHGTLQNPPWTTEIENGLVRLEKGLGFCVRCRAYKEPDQSSWAEWLFDLCWLEFEMSNRKFFSSLPLAMECEWGLNRDEVIYDLQKLA
jgi:hypothetical protein